MRGRSILGETVFMNSQYRSYFVATVASIYAASGDQEICKVRIYIRLGAMPTTGRSLGMFDRDNVNAVLPKHLRLA